MPNKIILEDTFDRTSLGANWAIASGQGLISAGIENGKAKVQGAGDFWGNADSGSYIRTTIALPRRWRVEARLEIPRHTTQRYKRIFGARAATDGAAVSLEFTFDSDNRLSSTWRPSNNPTKQWLASTKTPISCDPNFLDIRLEYDSETAIAGLFVLMGTTWTEVGTHTNMNGLTLVNICGRDSTEATFCDHVRITKLVKLFSCGDSLSTIRQTDTNASQANGVYSPDGFHWIRRLIQSATLLQSAKNDLTTNFARAGAYATIEHSQAWSAINPIPNFDGQITQLISNQTVTPDFDDDWVTIFFGTNDGGAGAAGTQTYSAFLNAIQNGLNRLRAYGFKNYIVVAPESRYFGGGSTYVDYENWVASWSGTNNLRSLFFRVSTATELESAPYTDGTHYTPAVNQNIGRAIAGLFMPKSVSRNVEPAIARFNNSSLYAENGLKAARWIIQDGVAFNLFYDQTWTTVYPDYQGLVQRGCCGKLTISPTQASNPITARLGYIFPFGNLSQFEFQLDLLCDTLPYSNVGDYYMFVGFATTITGGNFDRGAFFYLSYDGATFVVRQARSPLDEAYGQNSGFSVNRPFRLIVGCTTTSAYGRLIDIPTSTVISNSTITQKLPPAGTMLTPQITVNAAGAGRWRNIYLLNSNILWKK